MFVFSATCSMLLQLLFAGALLAGPSIDDKTQAGSIGKRNSRHLPNLIQVTDQVYSGGLPEDEPAFQELQRLGIRTIISVDGAKPNVELAEKYSMRYVHLPHGYDGISDVRGKEIAKALKTFEPPFYIHCHHGKHRSPAATAVGCRALGWISADQSLELLKLAGTDPKYKGLFRAVQSASKVDTNEIDQLKVAFTSSADLPPMAHAMVEIEEHFESLRKLQQVKWQSVSHGKHSPQQTALLLQEQFRELLRMDDQRIKSAEFIRICQNSESAAERIEKLLRESSRSTSVTNQLDEALKSMESDCKSCHEAIRNR